MGTERTPPSDAVFEIMKKVELYGDIRSDGVFHEAVDRPGPASAEEAEEEADMLYTEIQEAIEALLPGEAK
jgi:hypothetical protein